MEANQKTESALSEKRINTNLKNKKIELRLQKINPNIDYL